MHQHLSRYEHFKKVVNLMKLPDTKSMTSSLNEKRILDKCRFISMPYFVVVDFFSNWFQLQFLEEFYIKMSALKIHDGLKCRAY